MGNVPLRADGEAAVHVDVTGGRDSDKGHPMFEAGLLIISVSIAWSNHLHTNSFTMY